MADTLTPSSSRIKVEDLKTWTRISAALPLRVAELEDENARLKQEGTRLREGFKEGELDEVQDLKRRLQAAELSAEEWKTRASALQDDVVRIQDRYSADCARWEKFKQWWTEMVAAKERTGSKARLKQRDRQVLRDVGIQIPQNEGADQPQERLGLPASHGDRMVEQGTTDDLHSDGTKAAAILSRRHLDRTVEPHISSLAVVSTLGPVSPQNTPPADDSPRRPQATRTSVPHTIELCDEDDEEEDIVFVAAARQRQLAQRRRVSLVLDASPTASPEHSARQVLRKISQQSPQCRHPAEHDKTAQTVLKKRQEQHRVIAAGTVNARSLPGALVLPPSGPSSSQRPKVKAESDDEGERYLALQRTCTPTSQEDREHRALILESRKRQLAEMAKNPGLYKGRGRYAAELREAQRRRGHFELIPDLNGGVGHEYHEVVRDRRTRRQMHAYDCSCCKDYWDLVGAPVSPPPSGRRRVASNPPAESASRDRSPRNRIVDEVERTLRLEEAIEEEQREQERLADDRRQRAGRHRTWGRPPATPEGYWDIGFPSTPRAEAINASAKRQREAEEWHKRHDKRYRRRD